MKIFSNNELQFLITVRIDINTNQKVMFKINRFSSNFFLSLTYRKESWKPADMFSTLGEREGEKALLESRRSQWKKELGTYHTHHLYFYEFMTLKTTTNFALLMLL